MAAGPGWDEGEHAMVRGWGSTEEGGVNRGSPWRGRVSVELCGRGSGRGAPARPYLATRGDGWWVAAASGAASCLPFSNITFLKPLFGCN